MATDACVGSAASFWLPLRNLRRTRAIRAAARDLASYSALRLGATKFISSIDRMTIAQARRTVLRRLRLVPGNQSLRTLERHGCAALVNFERDSSVGRSVGWVAVGLVRGIAGTPDPDPNGVIGIGRARYPGEDVAGRPVHLHRPGRSVPEPPLELIGHRAPGCARGDGDGRARQLWP